MWSDLLTNPKSGRAFIEDKSMLMNSPLVYVDDKYYKDIEKSLGSDKSESYVWVKHEGILHKPSYSQVAMKSNTHLLQYST